MDQQTAYKIAGMELEIKTAWDRYNLANKRALASDAQVEAANIEILALKQQLQKERNLKEALVKIHAPQLLKYLNESGDSVQLHPKWEA